MICRTVWTRWMCAMTALVLTGTSPTTLGAAAPSMKPAPIDIDRFDASRKTVALPNGMTLAYIELGNPRGRPVLLVHGMTDSARDWVPLLPYLSPTLRLILVDIRGHGQSSKPECCYTRLDFAYDLKLLLDALSLQRVDIVGHSLGSIICQTLAEEWPERVGRVVLISTTGGPPRDRPAPKPAFDYVSEIRKLQEPLDPESPFMLAWWSTSAPVDADFLRRQRKDAAAIPLRVWLAIIDQNGDSADLQRTLPRLKAPTLVVWGGAKDPFIPEENRQTLREGLPGATIRILPGLGHNPFWEDPQAVADVLNPFLLP